MYVIVYNFSISLTFEKNILGTLHLDNGDPSWFQAWFQKRTLRNIEKYLIKYLRTIWKIFGTHLDSKREHWLAFPRLLVRTLGVVGARRWCHKPWAENFLKPLKLLSQELKLLTFWAPLSLCAGLMRLVHLFPALLSINEAFSRTSPHFQRFSKLINL